MTPIQFVARWQNNKLNERAGAQGHFDDLCDLLGVDKPRDADHYCFERGAKKSSGGDGWADVWKRNHFAWENKKPGRDLDKALKQLTDYSLQLESPPLLVVCDRERIIIHTAFTGYPDEPREIRIEDLVDDGKRQILKWVFTDPLKLRPEKSTAAVTEEAAGRYAALADAMRQRGLGGNQVAHFLVQCLFCMFAEDEGLLPEKIFTGLLAAAKNDVAKASDRITKLFTAMQEPKGVYGNDDIEWFNGGLFKHIAVPAMTLGDLETLRSASADMDWRAIDPTIFGTLFERGLGTKRAALGAHYTDTGTIAKLVEPVVHDPLLAEWEAVKAKIADQMTKAKAFDEAKVAAGEAKVTAQGKKEMERKLTAAKAASTRALNEANALYRAFLLRLGSFRVLDPACGSGNFLYLALKALRDVEKRAQVGAQELGLQAETSLQTGPQNILGLEINEFAAELARVTVWIGDIQWCRQNGWPHSLNPILKPLDGIENRDALLNDDGSEAAWPKADVIVGNPPFIGDKKMRGELGDAYVDTLRKTYASRVPGGADLVCYWFEKARAQIAASQLEAAGLVATNSIRGGANRKVLDRIVESTSIFLAWGDEPWVNDGAAVRVSMVGFGDRQGAMLDGDAVATIHADLTAATNLNLTVATKLGENFGASFQGPVLIGPFEVGFDQALDWMKQPNPNGLSNAKVLRPITNGKDIASRSRGLWVIDFGSQPQAEAALFELPFQYTAMNVKPLRATNPRPNRRDRWWMHGETGAGWREAIQGHQRYVATSQVSKHRFFVWCSTHVWPHQTVISIARSDDATFGILHSRFHELWALRMGTALEDRPRYTPTTTFETFPFPEGMTPRDTRTAPPTIAAAQAIAVAAQKLDQLRTNWLTPPEWTDWAITPEEQAAGFPKRPVAKAGHEDDLKKRTLTNLYNTRPAWLTLAHETLDKAVAAAYGWNDYAPDWTDAEILRRLLALNKLRSATP
ncbi:DNA methyltransferase [Comamonas sp. MYb21]|uniref:class I SAM-dependent DNA methyltransferase n=1 Tax=Comamonas sp. MYb21 TaxID=1848648 RepID=UPI00309BCDA0